MIEKETKKEQLDKKKRETSQWGDKDDKLHQIIRKAKDQK